MTLTARQEEIRAEVIRVRRTWSETWEAILRLDPEFLLAYLNLSAVPWRKNYLPDKVKELIYLAIDANATHMYLPGVRSHVKAALSLGVTQQEIMEVLELSATLGIHAMNVGVPILVEVLEEKGSHRGYGNRVRRRHPRSHGRRANTGRGSSSARRCRCKPLRAVTDRYATVGLITGRAEHRCPSRVAGPRCTAAGPVAPTTRCVGESSAHRPLRRRPRCSPRRQWHASQGRQPLIVQLPGASRAPNCWARRTRPCGWRPPPSP